MKRATHRLWWVIICMSVGTYTANLYWIATRQWVLHDLLVPALLAIFSGGALVGIGVERGHG